MRCRGRHPDRSRGSFAGLRNEQLQTPSDPLKTPFKPPSHTLPHTPSVCGHAHALWGAVRSSLQATRYQPGIASAQTSHRVIGTAKPSERDSK